MTEEGWPFDEARDVAACTCCHVLDDGAPVLYVSHDGDGEWQFLCGAEGHDVDDARLIALGESLELDPSLGEVAHLCAGFEAERAARGEPWSEHDTHEDAIREHIADVGWSVMAIPDDEVGPGFAYTIGLVTTFDHPEVLISGLDPGSAVAVLNWVGESIRDGQRFADGQTSDGVLERSLVLFRSIDRDHYRDHFGYAMWLHDGDGFPALQLVWPDEHGRLPDHERCDPEVRAAQPRLDRPAGD